MFKRKYLKLAKENEDVWHKEFFSVHDSQTIPGKIKAEINSIYKEALNGK